MNELNFDSLTFCGEDVCKHCGEIKDGFNHPNEDDAVCPTYVPENMRANALDQWVDSANKWGKQ